MEVEDRLIRARIQLQKQNPFFAYLSLFLKFKDGEGLPEWAGAGVDLKGNFYYKKEFFEKLKDSEIKGIIAHEIGHLFLFHLLRKENREQQLFNLACDIVVNSLLVRNDFELPDGCIVPDNKDAWTINNIKIEKCSEKTAEEIYDELCKQIKENEQEEILVESGGFDEHIREVGEGEGKNEKELSKIWNDRINEAVVSAKMRGNLPVGIERLFERLHESRINWKNLLNKYIMSYVKNDFTWAKPNKKSVCIDIYLPDYIKEKIKVAIGIDTSGSIGQEELEDFLSEVIGIAKAYRNKIEMTLITHETEVNDIYKIENGNIEKIKKIKIRGGGGTSHKDIFEKLNNMKEINVCVFLTDGYSDLDKIDFKKNKFDSIFVISKEGDKKQLEGKECKVIEIK